MRRINQQYKIGDKILVKRKKNSKHELEFMGPFPITKINDNGTVRFQKGIINNAVNISRIKPFFDYFKRVFTTTLFLFKTPDHSMVHFKKGIFNANTDFKSMIISTSHT